MLYYALRCKAGLSGVSLTATTVNRTGFPRWFCCSKTLLPLGRYRGQLDSVPIAALGFVEDLDVVEHI